MARNSRTRRAAATTASGRSSAEPAGVSGLPTGGRGVWHGRQPREIAAPAERVAHMLLAGNPRMDHAILADDSDRPVLRMPRINVDADPAVVCATLLVRRLLRESLRTVPELRARQIIVLEVPAEPWVGPVGVAWRALMAGGREPAVPRETAIGGAMRRRPAHPTWMLFDAEAGDDVVAKAALQGIPMLGVSAAPNRVLPGALVRAADLRLVLPRPDPSVLRLLARILTGCSPTMMIERETAHTVLPDMLRLARRSRQTADDWLARVTALVAVDSQGPRAITLAELDGMPEVVAWGTALAQDLADYRTGKLPWSAVDRGVLLCGPPGVGKTTAAAAIAHTCRVPLVATSYGMWQSSKEGHLGHVVQAIRRDFDRARGCAPAILFIDELDSIRGRDAGGYRDDWWSALTNVLLEQLDGLTEREGVVVIGATNHPGAIDPALIRAGRLDRVITVPFPDAAALRGILRFHLKNDLAGADLGIVADRMEARGQTGADAEKAVRGARRRARRAGRAMTIQDLLAETAAQRVVSPEQRRVSAVHEAGHAAAVHVLATGSLVRVSVRERGDLGGWTALHRSPETITRSSVDVTLRVLLSGRAAEEVLIGAPSSGAGGGGDSDLARATDLASEAVMRWGFGQGVGSLRWRGALGGDDRSRPVPTEVDREIDELLDRAYAAAVDLVRSNKAGIQALADHLSVVGEVDGSEVHAFLDRHGVRAEPSRPHASGGSAEAGAAFGSPV